MMHNTDPIDDGQAWIDRLIAIGHAVRDRIILAREQHEALADVVAYEGGDTIFAVDRHVEPVIDAHIEAWPASCKPLLLVAEGMGPEGRKRFEVASGTGEASDSDEQIEKASGGKRVGASMKGKRGGVRYRVLIDPIDGTRNIMYDKRAAWFIASVFRETSEGEPSLADAFASVMVELPTSKQGWADTFSACDDKHNVGKARNSGKPGKSGVRAIRQSLTDDREHPIEARPSDAVDLHQGFAQVANFFPGTKVLAAELMERIVQQTLGHLGPGEAAVFDDQYITTAGQMVEIMTGRDRFVCDLRPLFYRVMEKRAGETADVTARGARRLECHPYDLAGMLVAESAGVILTDGFGRPLDAPLNVHHGVHWCAYANVTLQRSIEPVIQGFWKAMGITA